MADPNAIVATSVRFDPVLDRAPEEVLREVGSITVVLDGERRVVLVVADERSAGFARVLDGISKQGLPVYVEIDPDNQAITRLLLPLVVRVTDVRPGELGLDVALEPSHAHHVLRLGDPDADGLERELRSALESRQPVLLTENDTHHIIDVRPFTPDPDGPLLPFPPIPGPEPPPHRLPWPLNRLWPLLARLWKWIWWWFCWPWWWFRCTSAANAQQVFNTLAATTCDPLTVPPPCIPFRYPDDGCWARAHEMCRLMIGMGLSPRKVWIDASSLHRLHVSTKNHPQCFVEWGWHVAPTLCVRGPGFLQTQRMVMDPSLFTTPVTESTWKGVQGDPNATLTGTGADQFWHGGGTDPTYSASNSILAQYRLALQLRAVQSGPPPYANCP